MSRMRKRGNCMRGWAGLFEGEVVRPLPIASVATMKYFVVSSALPGRSGSRAGVVAADRGDHEDGVRLRAFSVPCVT